MTSARENTPGRAVARLGTLAGDAGPVKIAGTVIACDFATVTGFAIARDGRMDCTGTESFKPKRGDSPGFKWTLFGVRFRELLDAQQPDLFVYELPFIATMKSATVAEVAFGMVTRAKEICDERGIAYRGISNSVIKQWATGKGNANKEAMQRAAASKWALYDPARDEGANEADAAFLLDYALAGFPDLAAAKAEAVAADRAAAKDEKERAGVMVAEFIRERILALLVSGSLEPWKAAHIHGGLVAEAQTLGATPPSLGSVKALLVTLEAEGAVCRSGRGWRLAG